MGIWPFNRSRADEDGERLLQAVTRASRIPAFFGEGRVPDTLEGRFELMTLNGALAMVRLRADPAAAPLAQAFADKFFRFLDAGLREAGVGDTSVPKRMRKMANAFYGRLDAYAGALDDGVNLKTALGRNIWGDEAHPFAPGLAAYAQSVANRQAEAPVGALFAPAAWTQG